MQKLTIIIVDKQPIFRQGLRQAVSSYEDIEVVGECSPTADTWRLTESLSPDIALIDVGTPPVCGFDVTRQIATHCPKVGVVILTSEPDDSQLFEAIKSGASAFISKDIAADELVKILKGVGRGEYPINDSLLRRPNAAKQVLRLFRNYGLKNMDTLMTPLSDRETQILKYVAEGNPNKSIAHALNIHEQTIKNHISSMMRKLHANDRTHAVVLAIRNGWLSVEEASDLPAAELTAHR